MAIWQPRAMENEACLSSGLDVMEYVRRYIIYMREDTCDGVCGKSRHVFFVNSIELLSHTNSFFLQLFIIGYTAGEVIYFIV